jgi:hypothetical protein
MDESKAMRDLNGRIQQLTKLILTSQTVDEMRGDDSRSSSPVKVDFDMSPYEVREGEGEPSPRLFLTHTFLLNYSYNKNS